MTQWEYKAIASEPDAIDLKPLKILGLDGWELVAYRGCYAIFKRPIPEKDPVTERMEFARDFFAGGVM